MTSVETRYGRLFDEVAGVCLQAIQNVIVSSVPHQPVVDELAALRSKISEQENARVEVMRAGVFVAFMQLATYRFIGRVDPLQAAKSPFIKTLKDGDFEPIDRRIIERCFFHLCGDYARPEGDRAGPDHKVFTAPSRVHPRIFQLVTLIDPYGYATQFSTQPVFSR
ncbi:MAG: hypothetical protein AAGJ87_15355 [Pseudomonadota bacterium]